MEIGTVFTIICIISFITAYIVEGNNIKENYAEEKQFGATLFAFSMWLIFYIILYLISSEFNFMGINHYVKDDNYKPKINEEMRILEERIRELEKKTEEGEEEILKQPEQEIQEEANILDSLTEEQKQQLINNLVEQLTK